MTQYAKAPIEPSQFARNGQYPDGFMQAELSDVANRCALFRLKQLACFGSYSQNVPSNGGDDERVRWRFRFVSSPYAAAIIFKASLAQGIPESSSSRPRVRLRVANNAGTTQGDAELNFGASGANESNPEDLANIWTFVVSSGTTIWAPTANTAYQGTISDLDCGRVIGATVYEVSLNTDAPFNAGHGLGTPILDLHRQELVAGTGASANGGLRQMWKTQAAPLFQWTVQTAATARTRSSATAINVIDNAATAAAADKPGYTLDLRNKSTIRRTTVPVTFYAYGADAVGTGGVVQIRDSTDTVVASITAMTTAGWYTTTADLPATLAKYDLFYKGDGTNTFTLSHICAYQYATGA